MPDSAPSDAARSHAAQTIAQLIDARARALFADLADRLAGDADFAAIYASLTPDDAEGVTRHHAHAIATLAAAEAAAATLERLAGADAVRAVLEVLDKPAGWLAQVRRELEALHARRPLDARTLGAPGLAPRRPRLAHPELAAGRHRDSVPRARRHGEIGAGAHAGVRRRG